MRTITKVRNFTLFGGQVESFLKNDQKTLNKIKKKEEEVKRKNEKESDKLYFYYPVLEIYVRYRGNEPVSAGWSLDHLSESKSEWEFLRMSEISVDHCIAYISEVANLLDSDNGQTREY